MEIDFLGSNASLHHIGMAFKKKPKELDNIRYFDDPIQKVTVGFISLNGCQIEVVIPLSEDAPILNAMKKGTKLLHLCYEVDNIVVSISNAQKNNCIIVSNPVEAVAFENRKIAWIFHKNYGLIEILERSYKNNS